MWPLDPWDRPGGPGLRTTLRRWGALLALAGAALPGQAAGETGAAVSPERATAVAGGSAESPAPPPSLLIDDPWEAAVVEPVPPEGVLVAPPEGTRAAVGAPPAAPEERARALPGSALVPEHREYLRPWLVRYAEEHGLPADLIMAQAWKESSWRSRAVSEDDARGVMQLVPTTVEFVSRRLLDLDHDLDPFDPEANIRMGTRLMRHLVDRLDGDYRRALMAYNQGITSLLTKGPYREAVGYADAVMALRPEFSRADGGSS